MKVNLEISNHESCRDQVEREGIPFHHLDFSSDKEAAFREAASLVETAGARLLILARFMQILPPWLCREYAGRAINIHHSFLPAFVGANPYCRAFERGDQLIGATCHYATSTSAPSSNGRLHGWNITTIPRTSPALVGIANGSLWQGVCGTTSKIACLFMEAGPSSSAIEPDPPSKSIFDTASGQHLLHGMLFSVS